MASLASSRGTVSAYFGADKLAAENRIAGFGAHGCRGPPPHAMPLGFEAWNGRPHHRSVNLASPMSRGTGLADEGWVVLVEGSGRGERQYLVGLSTPPECEGPVRERYLSEPGAVIRAVAPLRAAALNIQKLKKEEVRPW
jgi:hypothetical protein